MGGLKRIAHRPMNKSSAVVKMGDDGHNRHGPKSGDYCDPFHACTVHRGAKSRCRVR